MHGAGSAIAGDGVVEVVNALHQEVQGDEQPTAPAAFSPTGALPPRKPSVVEKTLS